MSNLGFYIIPILLLSIIVIGILQKVPVFESFVQGASEGINSTFSIAPSLIGLITAVTMLKASGALDIFSNFVAPLTSKVGIPAEVIPLALLRPVSGSGSIALLDNIFKNFGPDTFTGRLASIIMGSTETTFYTLTVYFGSVGIKNFRHAVPASIMADFSAFITATILMHIIGNQII